MAVYRWGPSLLSPLLLRIVIGVVVLINPALKERDKSADMDSSLRRREEVVSDAVVATRTRRILTSSFMFVSVEWVRDESLK